MPGRRILAYDFAGRDPDSNGAMYWLLNRLEPPFELHDQVRLAQSLPGNRVMVQDVIVLGFEGDFAVCAIQARHFTCPAEELPSRKAWL